MADKKKKKLVYWDLFSAYWSMSVDTLLIHFPKDLLKQIKLPPTFKKEVRLSLSFPGKKQLNLILVLPPYLVICLGRNSREVQFQPASGKKCRPHCLWFSWITPGDMLLHPSCPSQLWGQSTRPCGRALGSWVCIISDFKNWKWDRKPFS